MRLDVWGEKKESLYVSINSYANKQTEILFWNKQMNNEGKVLEQLLIRFCKY